MSVDSNENATPEKKLGGCTGKGFMPGQSGNPGGRKKKPITEMLEQIFAEHGDTIKESIVAVFTGKSGMAKVMLLGDAADRIEGKVSQPVEVNGELSLTLSERMARADERLSESSTD